MKSFYSVLFLVLGILTGMVMAAALLFRPMYSDGITEDKGEHLLILTHIPSGKIKLLGRYSGGRCELERDAMQASADSQAPRQFFMACLPR